MQQTILGLFPGQGSQKVGMGNDLYQGSAVAKEYFERANEALHFDLAKVCFVGPADRLTATEIAQPAILTVSTICYEIYKNQTNSTQLPVVAAGHSLGEYSALVAAQAISFDDAVLLVHKRGRYMQEAVPAGVGGMSAILGSEPDEIETALQKITAGVAQIANINAPGQIVVAGHIEALKELKSIMPGAKIMQLPVSAPFHSTLMKPAEEKLRLDLEKVTLSKARFPIYANFSATAVQDPEDILEALTKQVCGRVRWVESIKNILLDTRASQFIEFGVGNVLSGLMKRIDPNVNRLNVDEFLPPL